MQAIVIYESLTGNTGEVGRLVAAGLESNGIPTTVCNITDIDLQALSDADLVVLGTWVDGAIFFGQKPGRSGRITSMPNLSGKKVVVYCTYAIRQGATLEKLHQMAEDLGGDMLGGLAIKRNAKQAGATDLVDRLVGSLAS